MALEDDLIAVLATQCPEVHAGTAPYGTQQPYVTWQHAGGFNLRYVDNSAATSRNALIQVNTWAATPKEAHALILRIEEALCTTALFQAKPLGQPVITPDDADVAIGYLQTYTITGAR